VSVELPIDKAEFIRGKAGRPYYFEVLEFLEKNRDKAYTADEIDRELGVNLPYGLEGAVATGAGLAYLFAVLDSLVRDGKVSQKMVEEDMYFMAV
jgi:hypothetical protein